jgi:endonuclease YncB( thermonuclease family)
MRRRRWQAGPIVRTIALLMRFIRAGIADEMFMKFLCAILLLLLPAMAQAADITGVPKIREGDQIQIGNHRIRLGGIDAPSADQLCLNTKGERWTCGVAARDELIKHSATRAGPATPAVTDRRGRTVARCEVDGEDIQKWLVRTAGRWPMTRISATTRPTKKPRARPRPGCGRARSSRRGTGASATRRPPFSAPPSRRKRQAILLASASGPVAPSPDCTIKGNVNRSGECIYHQPTSRWYAKIEMKISKGTRWFCSVDEAEAAGCRETRRR